jgi:hypothetical protein
VQEWERAGVRGREWEICRGTEAGAEWDSELPERGGVHQADPVSYNGTQ